VCVPQKTFTHVSAHTHTHTHTRSNIVRGYAWSGGGCDVVRVDVSADGGASWQPTRLFKVPGQKPGRAWAWTLWEVSMSALASMHCLVEVIPCSGYEALWEAAVWHARFCARMVNLPGTSRHLRLKLGS
jgi:hypothetical protein